MGLNDEQQRLSYIYKQLYQYRDLLKGSPALTLDLSQMDEDAIAANFDAVNTQLQAVIAYLLGIKGTTLTVSGMLSSLDQHYKKDDFWRKLLLDYIEICQEQSEAELASQKQEMAEEGLSLYERLKDFQRRRKEIIASFTAKIAPEKFPVDAERMFRNYLNMADLDEAQAWNVLTTNPAFFSPLIVEDAKGKRILSVAAAKDVNKKMGDFIRKMKA